MAKFKVTDENDVSRVINAPSKEAAQKAAAKNMERFGFGPGKFSIQAITPGSPGVRTDKFDTGPIPTRSERLSEAAGVTIKPGELDLAGVRADQKFSDTMSGQIAKLKERGIEARIISDPESGDPLIIAKDPETGEFVELDSPEKTTVFGDLVGDIGGSLIQPEVLLDIASMFPSGRVAGMIPKIPAIAKGTSKAFNLGQRTARAPKALGAATARTGITAGGAGTGAGLGDLLGSLNEERRGFQDDPLSTILGRAGETAAMGAGGEAALRPLGAGFKLGSRLTKRMFLESGPIVDDAIEGAEKLGLPDPVVADLHPTYTSALLMSSKSGVQAQSFTEGRFMQAYDALRKLNSELGDIRNLPADTLREIVELHGKKIEASLMEPIAKGTQVPAGKMLQEGVQAFDSLGRANIARRYDALRQEFGSTVRFNVGGAQETARNAQRGTRVPFNKEAAKAVKGKGKKTKTLLVDVKGKPLVTDFPEQSLNVDAVLSNPQLKSIVDDLTKITAQLDGSLGTTGLQKMQTLRTRAFNVMDDPKLSRNQRSLASKIHHELSEAMENPVGGNAKFTRDLKVANAWFRNHEALMSKSYIRRLLQTDVPREIGQELMGPANVEMLRYARRMAPEAFKEIQAGFREMLRANPDKIRGMFKQPHNQKGLNLLMSDGEIVAYAKFADEMARFQKSGIVRLAGRASITGKDIMPLMNNRAQLSSLVQKLGGKQSAGGGDIANGVMLELLNKATVQGRRGLELNPRTVVAELEKLRETGNMDIIFEDDFIRNLDLVKANMAILPRLAGVGEGMQTASIAASANPANIAFAPHKFVGGQLALLRNYSYARMLTGKLSKQIVKGQDPISLAGKGGSDASYMRTLSSALFVAANSAEKDAEDLFGSAGDILPANEVRIDPNSKQRERGPQVTGDPLFQQEAGASFGGSPLVP